MGPLAVLDSNVILYLVNGQLADPLPVEGYLVSIISKIEVLGFKGFNSGEEQAIQSLLEQVVVFLLMRIS